MSIHRVSLTGGLLASALVVIGLGCSGNSPKPDASSGTGGAPSDGGGAGHDGSTGSDVAPTDGSAGRDGGGTDLATGDVATDSRGDAGDAGRDGSSVCTTFFGAANPVQYAFNGGANAGWYHFLHDSDPPNPSTGVTTSLGASYTDGKSCPGALLLRVNFMAYGLPNAQAPSGSAEFFYGVSPGGRSWTAYKNLHAWIKVEATDYQQLAGVYFYVKSGNQMKYQSAPVATGTDVSNGEFRELVIDLTNVGTGPFTGVTASDVQLIGFQVLLINTAPPTGAPATPSPVTLLVDDIWLEALPASDAGTDGGAGDVAADAPSDTPAGG